MAPAGGIAKLGHPPAPGELQAGHVMYRVHGPYSVSTTQCSPSPFHRLHVLLLILCCSPPVRWPLLFKIIQSYLILSNPIQSYSIPSYTRTTVSRYGATSSCGKTLPSLLAGAEPNRLAMQPCRPTSSCEDPRACTTKVAIGNRRFAQRSTHIYGVCLLSAPHVFTAHRNPVEGSILPRTS